MSDFEDKHMDFVLKHYQEGKFDTQKALQRFNEAHGIVQKPVSCLSDGSSGPLFYRYFADTVRTADGSCGSLKIRK